MTSGYDWSGAVGDVWAAEWRRTDRSFTGLSRKLDAAILASAPQGAFRGLDIGCGAGGTSLALAAARPDAVIVGVDLSAGLVEVARERSAGLSDADGASFLVGDAVATARGNAPFDILYSRHGVMFFDDPGIAFAGLRAAARPGAALVFSCFADWADNAFATALADAIGAPPPVPDMPGPFAFQDRDRVADILTSGGWTPQSAARVPFAYRAGEGAGDAAVADALSFFQRIGPAAPALRAAPPTDRARLLDRVTGVIRDHQVGNAIDFPACAWIWSARA